MSQIYEAKITVYELNQQGFLTGLIINEKGYQQEIKLARIKNQYFEVKDSNVYHCGVISASSSSALSFSIGEGRAGEMSRQEMENAKADAKNMRLFNTGVLGIGSSGNIFSGSQKNNG